jgi:hypothetical protein
MCSPSPAHQYFNPNAFVVPQAGTYGNVVRNSLNGTAADGIGHLPVEDGEDT